MIKAGTRGSPLAQTQTELVSNSLKKHNNIEIETKIIKTKGDLILDTPLWGINDKGLFTKELEQAILNSEVDFAVHSLKDLPTELPNGLILAAYLKRETPNDAILLKSADKFENIKPNGTVATGSMRRSLQLKKLRQDINFVDVRGNIHTRIKKYLENNWDGLVIAHAAMKRLNIENQVTNVIPFDKMLPAVGQGIIAVECRSNDKKLQEMLRSINHLETEICAIAERAFLEGMGGGCQVPIAGYAEIENNIFTITGLYMPEDGKYYLKDSIKTTNINDPRKTGLELSKKLLYQYEKIIK